MSEIAGFPLPSSPSSLIPPLRRRPSDRHPCLPSGQGKRALHISHRPPSVASHEDAGSRPPPINFAVCLQPSERAKASQNKKLPRTIKLRQGRGRSVFPYHLRIPSGHIIHGLASQFGSRWCSRSSRLRPPSTPQSQGIKHKTRERPPPFLALSSPSSLHISTPQKLLLA